MRETLSLDDVFGALIALEEGGRDAYLRLSEAAENPEAKKLFADLSRREEAHRALYIKMRDERNPDADDLPMEDEYRAYLDVLLKHNFRLLRRAASATGYSEGLSVGIELERQTILFLSDLFRFLRDSVREPITAVIHEEQNHLRALLELMD